MVDADSALALRERMLASLLTEPAATLVQHDSVLASAMLGVAERIVLIAPPPDAAPGSLGALLADLVRQSEAPVVHFVIVGGRRDAARELERALPSWKTRRQLGAHVLSLDGTLDHVNGARSAALRRAAERQATTAPLTADGIATRLVQSGERQGEL